MGYKLVLDEQPDTVVIGVGKDRCDPKTFKVLNVDNGEEGCLWAPEASVRWAKAMANLPHFIRVAEDEWEINPLNPAYKAPTKARTTKTPAAPAAVAPDAATEEEEPPHGVARLHPVEEQSAEELPLLNQGEEEITMTTETNPVPGADPEQEEPQGAPEAPTDDTQPPVDPQQAPSATVAQDAAEAPDGAPPATDGQGSTRGSWRYYVRDGEAEVSFDTVYAALLAHGVSQEDIESHKYWHRYDRLPKKYTDEIRRARVGTG